MDQEGLVITISADVRDAILNLTDLTDATGELAVEGVGNLTAVTQAMTALRAAQAEAGNTSDLGKINSAIKELSSEASRLRSAGTEGFDELGNKLKDIEPAANSAKAGLDNFGLSMQQMRVAFVDVARLGTGAGFTARSLGSQLYLLGPAGTIAAAALYGLYEVLNQQTDAQKKADEAAKQLKKTLLDLQSVSDTNDISTGSEAGNIAKVQDLAAAIQNTNNSYAQRNSALQQLRETNKAYFGDLTLEASSLATLSEKVKEYAGALVAEALVKGQVDQIAKVSEEYNKQLDVLNKLKDARDRAQSTVAVGQRNLPQNISTEGEEAAALQQQSLRDDVSKATQAFKDQQEAVDILATQIGSYRGALNQAIQEQLNYKPLKLIKNPDDLKSVIPILEQIQRIYEDISKPSKEPLFKQNDLAQQLNDPKSNAYQLFQDKIQEAFANGVNKGADDPKVKSAYDALAAALQAQLHHEQNPDLIAHFAFTSADIDDKEVKQFHDDAGKQLTDYMKKLPPIKSDIKVDPLLILQAKSSKDFSDELTKLLQGDAIKGFTQLGKDIGEALAGGLSGEDLFGSFYKLIGAALEQLGEYMLSIAPFITGIKIALKTLDPTELLIGGVGLIALGSLFETEASKSIKAFALGGIVTGPTLGLIGEAGPEVVFPLDRLNSFVKNTRSAGDQTVRVVGTIRGRDLAIASARDSKLQRLTS